MNNPHLGADVLKYGQQTFAGPTGSGTASVTSLQEIFSTAAFSLLLLSNYTSFNQQFLLG